MRAPRHRFSEDVRATTRGMASRMTRDGTVVQTPEQLDAWISGAPDAREPLEKGGYGTAFTSHDLLPLLHAIAPQTAGTPPEPEAPPPSSLNRWLVGGLVAIAILVLAVIVL